MKSKLLILGFSMIALMSYAQTDSLYLEQQKQIISLEQSILDLKTQVLSQDRVIANLNQSTRGLQSDVSVLKSGVANNQSQIETNSNELRNAIVLSSEESSERASLISGKLSSTVLYGIVISVILLVLSIISILLYWLLRKKNTSSIDKIKDAHKVLQEESIKLDEKLVSLLEQQMLMQKEMASIHQGGKTQELDHSLALKVADEIVRMETNLSRMDSTVKGYKQLSASVRRIKDNFLANGYEIVGMLGKPYNDGMKVIANFVPDETLAEGEQIITSIIKPQINYNGVMIQAAQITVSQNI